jgi:hypothetical protein
MGIFLGQLPPAEIARMKAELAETLIANFCYPRFYDYRTNSLRMRPVDRTKRQEVWRYLSSIDFSVWNRVDLTSPDFQRQVERLIIHFVQRNRAFFGQLGRKRMADVRTLISSCALLLAEGLREHLTGRQKKNPPFGSPRPVPSWATTNATGRAEPSWEQIVSTTMQLQQQIQEMRGEINTTPGQEARAIPVPTNVRRIAWGRSAENGVSVVEREVALAQQVPTAQAAVEGRAAPSMPGNRSTAPLTGPTPSSARKIAGVVPPGESPTLPIPVADKSSETRNVVPPANEDIAIFEQMRHQLVVWLRVEAVRSGMDISGLSPLQLLELLRQQRSFDETRLQIISTLLNVSNQVIKSGQANLLDYKQGLMFYLIHSQH